MFVYVINDFSNEIFMKVQICYELRNGIEKGMSCFA